jgi:ribonuclease Z
MAELIILGSSYAIPSENHENTHMALVNEGRTVLIDCVSNPVLRLAEAGLKFDELTDIILTHFHPDHVSGVPLLLMDLWLLGRRKPINIYGLHHTLERMEDLLGFYDWSRWPNFFPVAFYRLPEDEMTPVMTDSTIRIFASPVRHVIPTIGLRIEFPESSKVLAYSCDTEPCPEVVNLARDADVLIHEATGASTGHSSATQAAGIAKEAGARKLYLIHYPTRDHEPSDLLRPASEIFPGEVKLAEDFMRLHF